MQSIDIRSATDLLLHCVHADKEISEGNARLMYGGLSLLRKHLGVAHITHEMNDMFWSLKGRVHEPRVRFLEGDIFSRVDKSPIKGASASLVVPNSTTLASSSILVEQSQRYKPHDCEQKIKALGSVVSCPVRSVDGVGSVNYLVCRESGDPKLRHLDPCFLKLVNYGEVQTYLLPLFGAVEEVDVWVEALRAWLEQAETMELSCNFLDVYYLPKQQRMAELIERKLMG